MDYAESDPKIQSWVAALREELRKRGWTEGRNIEIDTRWGQSDVQLIKRFAKDLVALQADLMITASTPATAAMLQQRRSIPIIFVLVADPAELIPSGTLRKPPNLSARPLNAAYFPRILSHSFAQLRNAASAEKDHHRPPYIW